MRVKPRSNFLSMALSSMLIQALQNKNASIEAKPKSSLPSAGRKKRKRLKKISAKSKKKNRKL